MHHQQSFDGRFKFITFSMLFLFAAMALFQLWEQDVFWQVKAGSELYRTQSFPFFESWSYTSQGQPWHNFQWLATLLMAGFFHVLGVPGLVILRALILLVILSLTTGILRRNTSKHGEPATMGTIALVGLALTSRVQIRPDFIMLIPYTYIVLLWARESSLKKCCIRSFIITIICANIHPGCALFSLGVANLQGWRRIPSWGKRLALTASLTIGWSFTPYIREMPSYLGRYLFYSRYAPLTNPDFDSLSWQDVVSFDYGLCIPAFVICVLLGSLGLYQRLFSHLKKAQSLKEIVPEILEILAFIFFVGMSFHRQRVIPYAVIFMAPFVAEGLGLLLEKATTRITCIFAGSVVLMLGIHTYVTRVSWGLQLNEEMYPMECIRFLEKHRPLPHLLHEMKHGDAVVGLLPQYPVFSDTRETPFDHLGPLLKKIYDDPSAMAQTIASYQINTVLLPLNFFLFKAQDKDPLFRRRMEFFPPKEWAVVAFDNKGVLLLRRVKEHARLIERFSYRFVVPDIPPDGYIQDPLRTAESDAIFFDELSRCLTDMPLADYCALVKARVLRQNQTKAAREAAERFLLERLERNPSNATILHEIDILRAERGELDLQSANCSH